MMDERPGIGFLIGGVQKAGTTALARYLAQHPELMLPKSKEAHVFDDPGFDQAWDRARIDREYQRHFDTDATACLRGDATPIYVFHPTLIRRVAEYNATMRWIILLRDPVERAVSHYHMERARGDESWPLWAALLLERWRLRGHDNDWSPASPLRHWSYRARGSYLRQLDTLYLHFPKSQVLLLESTMLRDDHAGSLDHICDFLCVPRFENMPPATSAFEGRYTALSGPTAALARALMYRERREYARL